MISENLSPFIVYMESCSLPCSTSYFPEIGFPSLALAVRPRSSEILASFSALASSACSLSSGCCAQPIGIAKHHATRNASAIVVLLIAASPWLRRDGLRLLLQHRVETLEDCHPALEELVIVRRGLHKTVDREINTRGLVAGELAVMQVRLMDDLGDRFDAPVLDPEAFDEGLERAVLAVMAKVCAEHIKPDPLTRSVSRVGKGKLCVRIAEALNEPGRGDPVDVQPGPGDPRAAARG